MKRKLPKLELSRFQEFYKKLCKILFYKIVMMGMARKVKIRLKNIYKNNIKIRIQNRNIKKKEVTDFINIILLIIIY